MTPLRSNPILWIDSQEKERPIRPALLEEFENLQPELSREIKDAAFIGMLPDRAMAMASSHPAIAMGYQQFLRNLEGDLIRKDLKDVQICVIDRFQMLVSIPIQQRRDLCSRFTFSNRVREGAVLTGLTLGLLSEERHSQFGYFDEILAAGSGYFLLTKELNALHSLT